MQTMDRTSYRDAPMYRCPQGQPLLLPRRKSPSDSKNWSPNMQAVRATIRFAIATGRLDAEKQQYDTA